MPDGLKPFVDHYAVLECSPSNTPEQLKKAYHEKLRQFHPDKRPWSAGDYGQQVTQSLNEAWEALRFPALREDACPSAGAATTATSAGSGSARATAARTVEEAS